MPDSKFLAITIDVEAHPARADSHPFEKLVLGQFGDADPVLGIRQIIGTCDQAGFATTSFLDWPESHLYGDGIADIARWIDGFGHDVQVHAHPEHFPSEFFRKRAIDRPKGMGRVDDEQAEVIVSWLKSEYEQVMQRAPMAFRGGGYRYNPPLLEALARHGFTVSSNYNPSRPEQFAQFGPMGPFRWQNGVIELPVSGVVDGDKFTMTNFNLKRLGTIERFLDHAERLDQSVEGDTYMVLVLHSWSLLEMDADGFFRHVGEDLHVRLGQVLRELRAAGWQSIDLRKLPEHIATRGADVRPLC